jgi:D-glucosaminate-6-phosphate ammonia-lyase
MSFYEELGLQTIISARSFSTKLGGAPLPAEVLDAMRSAAGHCVRMDQLQDSASSLIAEVTGAEAGLVSSGASAALTLGAAACLAGFDIGRMNRLPDTTGIPNEIVIHRSHRNDYDHALRAAGAKFVEVGFSYYTFAYEVQQAIGDNTAALFYQAGGDGLALPFAEFAAIARRHGKPMIVDAAAELPPVENLRTFIEQGADLVAFSGGKHIRGPQSTGILCGRADLIQSAALQHQDMDVFPESWPLRKWIADGLISGPPHHGIGRGFKIGKEEIAGLMAALRSYSHRDFEAELHGWIEDMQRIVDVASKLPGVRSELRFPQPGGRRVPHAVISIEPAVAGLSADDVVVALQEGDPPIYVFERHAREGVVVFMPEALAPGQSQIIAGRLAEILRR